MNTRIIDTADAVVRRYKTRNPEDIISQRAIKLKDIRFCHDLLGYYTVLLNCEYIGINPNCTAAQRISALAHELGHALFDRKHASSGQAFQDTYFYSLDNGHAAVRQETDTEVKELLRIRAEDKEVKKANVYKSCCASKEILL